MKSCLVWKTFVSLQTLFWHCARIFEYVNSNSLSFLGPWCSQKVSGNGHFTWAPAVFFAGLFHRRIYSLYPLSQQTQSRPKNVCCKFFPDLLFPSWRTTNTRTHTHTHTHTMAAKFFFFPKPAPILQTQAQCVDTTIQCLCVCVCVWHC